MADFPDPETFLWNLFATGSPDNYSDYSNPDYDALYEQALASTDAEEVAELFRVIRDLADAGVAILFVSHFLDQVYEISDRLTVLRNGQLVGEYLTHELLRIDLVQAMIGKELSTLADLESKVHSGDRGVGPEAATKPFLVASEITRKGAIEPIEGIISTVSTANIRNFWPRILKREKT